MSLEQIALAAIVGLLAGVLAGYFVRVWVSRTTDSVAPMPPRQDVYDILDRHMEAINSLGTRFGQMQQDGQLMESHIQLLHQEWADFFDKTRKSEERQRGLTRRAEAAIGDEENTEAMDQQMLELMEQQPNDPSGPLTGPPMTREQYYRTHSE